jgi:hypothetical protein
MLLGTGYECSLYLKERALKCSVSCAVALALVHGEKVALSAFTTEDKLAGGCALSGVIF